MASAGLAAGETDALAAIRPLMEQHCFACHGSAPGKGGYLFSRWNSETDLGRDLARARAALAAVRGRSMPPSDEPQPDETARLALGDGLALAIQRAQRALPEDPGRTVLRRLSRAELDRTLRDLIGTPLGVTDPLPADGGEGFDNTADTLFLPGRLLEKYADVGFFDKLVRENWPLTQLIDGDRTLVNTTLAELYGYGGGKRKRGEKDDDAWREVKHSDNARAGVLGMAAVLAATSRPQRSSPVLRCRWILDRMLAEPPPPDTPALPSEQAEAGSQSLRASLEAHRKLPDCAACHARIDPLGFALERFDPIGRLRGGNVDDAGTLPDGTAVNGATGLRKVLLSRREQFVRAPIGKLLGYALGRSLEDFDQRTIDGLVDATRAGGWRAQNVLIAICGSLPFRHTRNAPITAPATAPPATAPGARP